MIIMVNLLRVKANNYSFPNSCESILKQLIIQARS